MGYQEEYARRKATGLCVDKGCKNPSLVGRVRCEKHLARINGAVEKFHLQHPGRRKHYNLLRYGIGGEEYAQLLENQGGVCAICGSPCPTGKDLSVDHDHGTGAIRGLLCHHCNIGLGHFKDNPALLNAAIAYLGRHQ